LCSPNPDTHRQPDNGAQIPWPGRQVRQGRHRRALAQRHVGVAL